MFLAGKYIREKKKLYSLTQEKTLKSKQANKNH